MIAAIRIHCKSSIYYRTIFIVMMTEWCDNRIRQSGHIGFEFEFLTILFCFLKFHFQLTFFPKRNLNSDYTRNHQDFPKTLQIVCFTCKIKFFFYLNLFLWIGYINTKKKREQNRFRMGKQRMLCIYEKWNHTERQHQKNNEIKYYKNRNNFVFIFFLLIIIDFGGIKYSTRKPHDYFFVSMTKRIFFFKFVCIAIEPSQQKYNRINYRLIQKLITIFFVCLSLFV